MRYQLLYPLEPGPHVSVFLVSDLQQAGMRKVLRLAGPQPRQAQELIEFERLYWKRKQVDGPLVPLLFDVGVQSSRVGFIFEFLERPFFPTPAFPLPIERALEISLQLSSLTERLHSHRFFFGYLTPSKLFRSPQGELRVNVGLPYSRRLRQEVAPASIGYAAPELLAGEPAGESSDLYSLGMLLHFLFSGQPPFFEEDPRVLRQKLLVSRPARLRKVNPEVPRSIEELVFDLTERSPGSRPCGAAYATSVLRQFAAGRRSHRCHSRPPVHLASPELDCFRNLCERLLKEPRLHWIEVIGNERLGCEPLCRQMEAIGKIFGLQLLKIDHRPKQGHTVTASELSGALQDLLSSLEAHSKGGHAVARSGSGESELDRLLGALQSVAASRPVMLRIDHLEAMETADLRFYRRLAELRDSPILIVGTLDPDCEAICRDALALCLQESGRKHSYTLEPLSRLQSEQLIAATINRKPSRRLAETVWNHCGGSPLYTERFLQELKRLGRVPAPSEDRRGCRPRSLRIAAPEPVAKDIQTKLNHLTSSQKKVLLLLSVLEVPVSPAFLAQLTGRTEQALRVDLQALRRPGLVSWLPSEEENPSRVSPSCLWVAEITLKGFSRLVISDLHGQAAVALQQIFLQTPQLELVARLCRHFLCSKTPKRANPIIWLALFFLKSNRRPAEAAELLAEAIEKRLLSLTQWNCARLLIDFLYSSGQFDRCLLALEELLAMTHWTPFQRATLISTSGRIFALQGDKAKALDQLSGALQILQQSADLQPQLYSEVLGDYLGCLARIGQPKLAGKTAGFVLDGLKRGILSNGNEKLQHSLSVYYFELGDLERAVVHESKAIELAQSGGDQNRVLGRLFNIATFYLTMGLWEYSRPVVRYLQARLTEIDNPELRIYIRSAPLIRARIQGRHSLAVRGIRKLLQENSRNNRSRHLTSELLLEIARNRTHQLRLTESRQAIRMYCRTLQRERPASSKLDHGLALCRFWLNAGFPGRALRQLSALSKDISLHLPARYCLMKSEVYLNRQDHSKALREVQKALKLLPASFPYLRTEARLLQSEILLQTPDFEEAEPVIEEALAAAKERFFLPLLSRAYLCKSKWLLLRNQPAQARPFALRALQVAKHLERPLQQSEIRRTLGKIDVALNRPESAIRQMQQGIWILKENVPQIPRSFQSHFRRMYLAPIQSELAKLLSPASPAGSGYLHHTRELLYTLSQSSDRQEVAQLLVARVQRSLDSISARCYLAGGNHPSSFTIEASCGKCSRSGKPLLLRFLGDAHLPMIVDRVSGAQRVSALGLPLRSGGELLGFLYLERSAKGSRKNDFAEVEIDYVKCIAAAAGVILGSIRESIDLTEKFEGLPLGDDGLLIGRHPEMKKVFQKILQVAPATVTVLIEGESGTGKELVARAIHQHSLKSEGPFVAVNCGAFPEELIENELFGHAEGSFTGASKGKPGLIEAAAGGTLFLDEISSLPLRLQARFLRVLEQKSVRRLGENHERPVQVRVISATNQSLHELVEAGRFRLDLFHRLNVFRIQLPPLRQRSADVPLLCQAFLERLKEETGRQVSLSREAVQYLRKYSFPGNVRQLKNILESLFHGSTGNRLGLRELQERLDQEASSISSEKMSRLDRLFRKLRDGNLDYWEAVRDAYLRRDLSREDVRELITRGLEESGGNYRKLLKLFHIPEGDYKRFLGFLSHHQCKVDFRQFRR